VVPSCDWTHTTELKRKKCVCVVCAVCVCTNSILLMSTKPNQVEVVARVRANDARSLFARTLQPRSAEDASRRRRVRVTRARG
jgi:hypothetical protein